MGRAKLPMELISNDKKRNMTFLKRKSGMIKKAHELKTLCDVNVCMIISPPVTTGSSSGSDHQEPEIFPADTEQVKGMIDVYKQSRPKGKIQICGLSDFFNDRKNKLEAELAKAKKRNLEAKYPTWFDFLNNASEWQLREFAFGLEPKIDYVKTQIEIRKGSHSFSQIGNFLDHYSFYPLDQNHVLTSSFDPMTMMMMMNDQSVQEDQKQLIPQTLDTNPMMEQLIIPQTLENKSMMMLLMGDENNGFDDNFILDPASMGHGFGQEQQQPFIDYHSMFANYDPLQAYASQVEEENEMMNGQREYGSIYSLI